MTGTRGSTGTSPQTAHSAVDSRYAWLRLAAALALITIGSSGMYVAVVALPAIEQDFGLSRSQASLPYTLIMLGWGVGGILMGRLVDRFGIIVPVVIGAVSLALGFWACALSHNLWQFALANGVLIGFLGISTTFAPLMADISHWFLRRRGLAVAICASGNYLAGAIWPPLVQPVIAGAGWRAAYIGLGAFCLLTMLPLALALRRRPPPVAAVAGAASEPDAVRRLALSPAALQTALCLAGVACCVAMSMPQVHIVALCNELGFDAARGAQMLAVMLGCGVVSRLAFGSISDRIGGLRTLLLGSSLQCLALFFFLPASGLVALFLASALFGLFQGGIVPAYAIIVREYFVPAEAGARVGLVVMATLVGMALGGWMSGAVFDWTGSYTAAFANGIAWNLLNISIVGYLLCRASHRGTR